MYDNLKHGKIKVCVGPSAPCTRAHPSLGSFERLVRLFLLASGWDASPSHSYPTLNSPVVRENSTTHRIRPELKARQLDLDSSELSIGPLTEPPESTITYRNQEQLTLSFQ